MAAPEPSTTLLPDPIADQFNKAVGLPEDKRPRVQWIEGKLPEIVDAAEAALISSGAPIYQRGNQLVRVVRRAAVSSRHFRRDGGAVGLVSVDIPYLVDSFTQHASWWRLDGRSGNWRPINCPDQVASIYLSRFGNWKMPRLWAALDAPTMRPDGTILQRPGYDEQTGILFDPGETDYAAVPDKPTRAQAEAALEDLQEAFGTFPYVDRVDQAVAIATVLGALIRRSLNAAPCTGITAPGMAHGKTKLANLIAIVTTGVPAPVMVQPSTEEEAVKLLLSILSEGEAIVLIDNIERPLEGAWLCAALTSESFTGRLLGRNVMATVPTSCTWIATGNQLQLSGDLRTRSLLCRLDARCERPEQRAFDGDIEQILRDRRPELVVAGLTVLRAFISQGERADGYVQPWGRFELWSDRIRAPLVWLGMADPCKSLAQLEREDPERTRLAGMLRVWRTAFGASPATVREGIDQALNDRVMREAFDPVCRDRSGQLEALRLGRWLQRHAGRIVDGLEFQRAGEKQGSALWQVTGEPVKVRES